MECLFLIIMYDEPAAPDGAPPRRISVSKHTRKHRTGPAVPRRGPEAGSPHKISWFNDFHGWVRTIAVHARFYQQKKLF